MSICLSCGNDQYSCIRTPDENEAEKAVDILRDGCARIDGLSVEKQSKCPEDMAMWAITKIERLQKALDEILTGKVSVKVTRRKK